MIESKLGMAASLAVAPSLSNVKYMDIDGFHSITVQQFEGALQYESGINIPVLKHGIGCTPSKEKW